MALSAGQGADDDINSAVRMHCDVGTLARVAAGRLKVTAKPDAAQAPALARRGAALLKALPIAKLERTLHHHAIAAVVIGNALRVLVRKSRGRNEIALAKRDAIEAVLLRRLVDQPFDHVNDLRPPGAAVGRGAHGG